MNFTGTRTGTPAGQDFPVPELCVPDPRYPETPFPVEWPHATVTQVQVDVRTDTAARLRWLDLPAPN